MIIRVQFVDAENKNVIYTWWLFMVAEQNTLLETFNGIYSNTFSCGRNLEYGLYCEF